MYLPKLSILSKSLLIVGSATLAAACSPDKQEVAFNKGLWEKYEDLNYPDVQYPYRDQMLNDLVEHHQLKQLTYQQLLDSLGEPANYGEPDDTIRYLISEGFESDIDPVHGKTLDLTLGPDSVVTSYKVSEW
jgi:hypothetical protein